MSSEVVIERVHAITDDVRALIYELDRGLAVAYPPEQTAWLDAELAVRAARAVLYRAESMAARSAAAASAFFDGFAEVKRMFVREASRGIGVAQVLLSHIEGVAIDAGVDILRLETGGPPAGRDPALRELRLSLVCGVPALYDDVDGRHQE